MSAAWLCLLVLLGPASGARILGIFPYRGASHWYVFQPLMEGLAERGHDVTVVSHMPRAEPLPNYRDISVADPSRPAVSFLDTGMFFNLSSVFYDNMVGMVDLEEYERVLSHAEVLALVDSRFDLVIMEMFNTDLFFGLAHRIGAPTIGFSSCSLMPWTADSLGVPNLPSYIPNNLGVQGPAMDWLDRIVNTLEVWAARAYYSLYLGPQAQALAEKYLGPLPSLGAIAANTSLLFLNTHFTALGQRPLPPSVIEVGGISVNPSKPLPKELEKKMNESSGVIYFSLGSVLTGSSLPQDVKEMFLSVLSASGKTVLWKMEEEFAPANPKIVTRSWFPQRDVLGHPKVELFISHCGLLGLSEAVASGVPVLCLPMYGDQPSNAKLAESAGFALHLPLRRLTRPNMEAAVSLLLGDKRFKERAREVSTAFRDRVMPPKETAIFWTEYLLRHGSSVFRGEYKKLGLREKEGLDLLLLFLSFLGLLSLLSFLYRQCTGPPSHSNNRPKPRRMKKKTN